MEDQVLKVLITGERESLTQLLTEHVIDLPDHIHPEPDGSIKVEAFVPSSYLQSRMVSPGLKIEILGSAVSRGIEQVGTGNRLDGRPGPISGPGSKE
jgi:hypothetical protein